MTDKDRETCYMACIISGAHCFRFKSFSLGKKSFIRSEFTSKPRYGNTFEGMRMDFGKFITNFKEVKTWIIKFVCCIAGS